MGAIGGKKMPYEYKSRCEHTKNLSAHFCFRSQLICWMNVSSRIKKTDLRIRQVKERRDSFWRRWRWGFCPSMWKGKDGKLVEYWRLMKGETNFTVTRTQSVQIEYAHNNAIRRVRQIWFFFLEGGGIFSIFFCTILSKNYTTNKNETNEERSPSRGTRFPFLICSSSTV